ncbi:MAG: hypothetical protein K6E34_10485 [Lachnospiraceae bacterium]|nr:hypothetical protein [Lachnospiraceae bacterium]
MDNTTAKVSCFARAYHFVNNTTQYLFGEMEKLLSESGFIVEDHLANDDMTKQFFDEYNKTTPDHPMNAPVGVDYVLAVRV